MAEAAFSSSPQIKDLDGEINEASDIGEASSPIPQINNLDGEINEASDIGEASSPIPQINNLDDQLKELTEERRKKSKVDIGHYRPLIRAIQKNDVKAQKDFLDKYPDAMKSEIDDFGNTVFHLIVQHQSFNLETVKLLEELVSKVLVDSPATLEILNLVGVTALDIAALTGNTQAVKVFVNMLHMYKLLSSKEEEAVYHAAFWGRKETVRYLLSVTDWTEDFALDSRASLLKTLIESNLHGIALGLLKHYPRLAVPEGNKFWNDTVYTLATKYRSFASGRKLGCWESLIYNYIPVSDIEDHIDWPQSDSKDEDLEKQTHKCSTNCSEEFQILPQIAATFVPGIKRIHDQKLMHTQTLEIVRLMISKVDDWSYKEASERLKKPVLIAASLGIHEFVDEVLKAYPNSAFFSDEKKHNIFLLAISYRKEKVFSLIHDQMALVRDYCTYYKDSEGGNILHLAATFVPSNQVPGSALQMQRELQWFQSVRVLFPSKFEEELNDSKETPEKVFSREHKDLVEKGEKWMRETATSCSVVAALIITIVFAAAITVPGGNNANGIPNYLNETDFRIFAISTAIALFSSTTSVQMFLGMLTSRYEEEDFLELLPRKLIIGLMTLFLSSSSMMVSFGAAFCIVLYQPWKWIIVLICLLGCVPITLFAWMQFPLLVDIFRFTYGPSVFRSMKR